VTLDLAAGTHYYELDDRGRLKLVNGQVMSHKFVPAKEVHPEVDAVPPAIPAARPPSRHPVQVPGDASGEPPAVVFSRPASLAVMDLEWDAQNGLGYFEDAWGPLGELAPF
jgi:hypothetical protein